MRSGAFRAPASRMRSQISEMKASDMSEPRNVRARQLAVHVHPAPLGAAFQGRHGLAWIQDARGIERALHVVERGDLGRAELHAHLPKLLDPDPMLDGDRATDFHAALEDPSAQLLAAFSIARLVGVVEDARVDVAVARVEN